MSKVQYQQKPTSSENVPQEERHYTNKRHDNYDNYRKPRYQDKEAKYKNKHGFDYDQRKISYNTEIPKLPEKSKAKPDQNKLNKKIEELQIKVKQLKKLRKQKKDSYKNGSKTFTDQIEAQKHNIELAKACLVVLNFDKNNLDKDLDDIENKINQHRKKIDFISKPTQKSAKINKIEEMNYQELIKEEDRITQEMSTRNLTKAEEVELSNKLNKIKKRKVQVPKENVSVHEHDDKYDEIQSHKNAMEKLRNVKQHLTDKSTDINNKIESIEEDIQDFEDNIEEIHEKLRNTDNSKLLEEAAEYKKQILAHWDEIEELKEQYKKKVAEYEQEQELIKHIQWATEIKAKKAEAWQAEKQERKKQKLKEKERQKKGDQKPVKQGEKKQGEKTEEEKPAFERKRINRNQKQIDACAFLIQYCKDLSVGSDKTDGQSTSQKEVKLEEALKKGEWAKMKNVEVIQSKKKKIEQQEQKAFKKKEGKTASQEPTDRFSHNYFVAQVFDSVKVLPPTKSEDLQKLINELEDKMEYYIAHPDEEISRSLLPTKESERDIKGKAPRRIINTQEFPNLS